MLRSFLACLVFVLRLQAASLAGVDESEDESAQSVSSLVEADGIIEGTDQENETIDAMEAALQQWLHDIEFVSRYRRVPGRSASIEAGLSRDWSVEFPEEAVAGVYNKAFGKVRVSLDWESEPQIVSETADSFEVAKFDVDEVSNSDILLTYHPQLNPRKPDGSALFTPRNMPLGSGKQTLGRYAAGWRSARIGSPLCFGGDPLVSCLQCPDTATSFSRRLIASDAKSIVIGLTYVDKGYEYHRRVDFSLSGSCPVIERIEKVMVGTKGDRWESVAQGFEFVECPGGPVARIVRNAFTNNDPKYPDLPFAVFEWRSHDLGKRNPTPDDFRVSFHEQTRIDGVPDLDAVMTQGKLDIDKASLRTLTTRPIPGDLRDQLAEREFQRRGESGGSRKVLLIVNACVLVILVLVFLLRRRT